MKKTIDNVNHPKHYEDSAFKYNAPECIDIARWLSFDLGNAFKYIWRASKKDDYKQDMLKAQWYIMDWLAHPNEEPTLNIAWEIFRLFDYSSVMKGEETARFQHSLLDDLLHLDLRKVLNRIEKVLIEKGMEIPRGK